MSGAKTTFVKLRVSVASENSNPSLTRINQKCNPSPVAVIVVVFVPTIMLCNGGVGSLNAKKI